jgi:homoserine kinase type II
MAQYSKLLESEIQEIADEYELTITGFKPIEQGQGNSNYLLVTNRDKYILTIFEIEPIRVAHMIKVLVLLAEYEYPAPRIQNLSNGDALTEYKGKPVLLKPYITGQVIKDLDESMVSQAGAALARLHKIPVPDYLPDSHTYEVKTLPRVMKEGTDQTYGNWLGQRTRFIRQNLSPGLPLGLVHGDLFYDNVLFEDGKFKAILDFEDIFQAYKVFDLGMAAVGLCSESTIIALNKVRALVNGYQEIRLLEEVEKESLQIFIEYAALLTSTWRYWMYNIEAPDAAKADKYLQMVKIANHVSAIPKAIFINSVFA